MISIGLQATPNSSTVDTRLFRSDYLPSEEQIRQITALLQSDEDKLRQCEEVITDLRRKLESVTSERLVLETSISQYRSALSIQRRIPTEIWENIFPLVCTSKSGYSLDIEHPSYLRDSLVPALTLARVCSRWGGIVRDCPRLWSSISVEFGLFPRNLHRLVKMFLKNSAQCTLDLCIKGLPLHAIMSPRAYQTPGEEEDKLMWRTLSRNFARCHRITLDMPQITSLNLRPSRSWDGTFPSLTSLIIRSEGSTPDSQFWQSFQSASKLTKVTISLRVAHWPEHIPYPQLVSLELTRLALHETENLLIKLNRCSSLRFLTLGDIQTGAMTIPPHIHVEMPLLQTLSIGFQGRGVVLYNSRYDSLYGLMEALSLPSLIEFRLHLIVEEQSGGVWPHPLLAMLKSATILRKVSLSLTCSDTISSTYGLYDLLKQTPNLTHFEFSLSRDRGRYSGVRAYRARADALISEVFFELGSRPDTFLPKVQCLSLRVMDITLNKETVSNVIGVAKLRGESHGAGSGNDRCSLKSLRLARFRVSPLEPEFILDDLLVSRIGELEKSGVKVIVEDLSDPGADGNVFLL